MGYTLTIGEYAASFEDDGSGRTYISHDVEAAFNDNAPAYGEPTDHTNSRWPAYSGWASFVRFTGLEELFEGSRHSEKSLLREHPGCFPLSAYHKEAIDAAHARLIEKYPSATPQMTDDSEADCQLARLTWLKYWVDWALANCQKPVFANS